ncbi:DUF5994 family protein [Nocardioides rubriscoriae]|uniref:DUF5994 family protein n=1 Tax=Nocardioides rubriscoriae TaxID=642762 RepID=UPI0011DF2B2F|nr:DUF5994 family protein [Nocardioides rubriscoriae]
MPTPLQDPSTGTRVPLRLALAEHPGQDTLDGAWWPQSRDLDLELADLVDHFPPAAGRVVRALFSPPDWDSSPRRVPIDGGHLKVGWFPHDDTHVIVLRTSDHAVLRLLVVPPEVSDDDGHEAMLAASTTGNKHSAGSLLRTVTDSPPVDPAGFWPAAGD